jgi:hypothetical protein
LTASGTISKQFEGHRGYISDMIFKDDFMFSVSWDNSLVKWSISSGTILQSFIFWNRAYSFLNVDEIFYVGVGIDSYAVWNETDRTVVATVEGYSSTVSSISVSDDVLVILEGSGVINWWSIRTGGFEKRIGDLKVCFILAMQPGAFKVTLNFETLFIIIENFIQQRNLSTNQIIREFKGRREFHRVMSRAC